MLIFLLDSLPWITVLVYSVAYLLRLIPQQKKLSPIWLFVILLVFFPAKFGADYLRYSEMGVHYEQAIRQSFGWYIVFPLFLLPVVTLAVVGLKSIENKKSYLK